MTTGNVRVLLIEEPSTTSRLAVRRALDEEKAFDVVGILTDVADAVRRLTEKRPDLILVDDALGRDPVLRVLRTAKAQSSAKLVLLVDASAPSSELAAAARTAGVHAVINKPLVSGDRGGAFAQMFLMVLRDLAEID